MSPVRKTRFKRPRLLYSPVPAGNPSLPLFHPILCLTQLLQSPAAPAPLLEPARHFASSLFALIRGLTFPILLAGSATDGKTDVGNCYPNLFNHPAGVPLSGRSGKVDTRRTQIFLGSSVSYALVKTGASRHRPWALTASEFADFMFAGSVA